MSKPKIFGLTRVRNEAEIITETLDHWGKICNGGIYLLDDCSTDNTYGIAGAHHAVRSVIFNQAHDKDRDRANWQDRQNILHHAIECIGSTSDKWFVYFDADERIDDFETQVLPALNDPAISGIKCRLFDAYITPDDVGKGYAAREWFGPEYRDILFFFRGSARPRYYMPSQREAELAPGSKIVTAGTIKHYGKAISPEEWERTCSYYAESVFPAQPLMRRKWEGRRGKAVKSDYLSDFKCR